MSIERPLAICVEYYATPHCPRVCSGRIVGSGALTPDPCRQPVRRPTTMAKRTCSVDDCERPYECRGLCDMHYQRWRKHGTTSLRTTADRFFGKVAWSDQRHDGTRCLVWAGLKANGYGMFSVGQKRQVAHRWLYEHWVGTIPEGLHLDHLCRNRACVNPAHLEVVTQAENNRRARAFMPVQTHCIHGHPFSGDNLYVQPKTGRRFCRACASAAGYRRRARRRAAREATK